MDEIVKIVEGFNFDKVLAYMTLTKWEYRGEQVTKEMLIRTAYEVLERVERQRAEAGSKCNGKPYPVADEGLMVATGGLAAYCFVWGGKVHYKLAFEPVHS